MTWCPHCAKTSQTHRDYTTGCVCCVDCGLVVCQDIYTDDDTFNKDAGNDIEDFTEYLWWNYDHDGSEAPAFERSELDRLANEFVNMSIKSKSTSGTEPRQKRNDNNNIEEFTEYLWSNYDDGSESPAFQRSELERLANEFVKMSIESKSTSGIGPHQKINENENKDTKKRALKTPAEALSQHFTKKKLSSKINYEALSTLLDEPSSPKKKRVDDDDGDNQGNGWW